MTEDTRAKSHFAGKERRLRDEGQHEVQLSDEQL